MQGSSTIGAAALMSLQAFITDPPIDSWMPMLAS
jgi:hypothetical protein